MQHLHPSPGTKRNIALIIFSAHAWNSSFLGFFCSPTALSAKFSRHELVSLLSFVTSCALRRVARVAASIHSSTWLAFLVFALNADNCKPFFSSNANYLNNVYLVTPKVETLNNPISQFRSFTLLSLLHIRLSRFHQSHIRSLHDDHQAALETWRHCERVTSGKGVFSSCIDHLKQTPPLRCNQCYFIVLLSLSKVQYVISIIHSSACTLECVFRCDVLWKMTEIYLFSCSERMDETHAHMLRHDEWLSMPWLDSFTLLSSVCADAQLIAPTVPSSLVKMISQQQQQQQQHSRSSTSDDDSGCALEEYAWCPPGLKAEQVSPHDCTSFDRVSSSLAQHRFDNSSKVSRKIKCHSSTPSERNIER